MVIDVMQRKVSTRQTISLHLRVQQAELVECFGKITKRTMGGVTADVPSGDFQPQFSEVSPSCCFSHPVTGLFCLLSSILFNWCFSSVMNRLMLCVRLFMWLLHFVLERC